MRVRNLIAKPSTFNGNPLLKKKMGNRVQGW